MTHLMSRKSRFLCLARNERWSQLEFAKFVARGAEKRITSAESVEAVVSPTTYGREIRLRGATAPTVEQKSFFPPARQQPLQPPKFLTVNVVKTEGNHRCSVDDKAKAFDGERGVDRGCRGLGNQG